MKPLDNIENLITFSNKRKRVLIKIYNDGPQSLRAIRDLLKVKTPEIQPDMKKMENAGILRKMDDAYELTLFGHIIVTNYLPFYETISSIEKNREFWEYHDLSAIPEELLLQIKKLQNCDVIESEEYNLFESHVEFIDFVKSATVFRGVTSIFIPSWIDLFSELSNVGADIEIITTPEILNKIKTDYPEKLKQMLINKNRIYLCNDIKIAFAVTNDFISLALYNKKYKNGRGGEYDQKHDLEGYDKEAISWGNDLYAYYKAMSTDIVPMYTEEYKEEFNKILVK